VFKVNIRYLDFVREWTKHCLQAKEDYNGDTDGLMWEMRKELYGTTVEKWWCGCPSFQKSPYHICKHLIRLYIGIEGLESNKPRMPCYGEVWRQTVKPVLWIHGVHEIGLLKVRDLRANSEVPLLTRYLSEDERLALLAEATTNPREYENQLDVFFDSSDEEIDSEDGHEDEDEAVTADNKQAESSAINRDAIGSRDVIREEIVDEFISHEMEGEQVKEQAELLERRLVRLVHTLQEIKKYPSGHQRLREIPSLQGSIDTVLAWSERRERIRNARALPTTFGAGRRGNVFM